MKLRKMAISLALAALLSLVLAIPAFAAVYEQDLSVGTESCTGTSHRDGAEDYNVRNAWKQYINRDSDSLEQGMIDASLMVKWMSEPNTWIVVDYECAVTPIIQTQDSADWSMTPQTAAYASSATKAVFRMEDVYADYTAAGADQATWGNLSVMSGSETDVLKVSKVVFYIGEEPDLTGLTVNANDDQTNPVDNTVTGDKETNNPQTGDSVYLFVAIASLGLAACAILLLARKKAVK